MGSVSENLDEVRRLLPADVRLVAVSKYHPEEALAEAYSAGQRIFGESHVQELVRKQAALPDDIQWHFIGHLQTNKVKYIVPFIDTIEAVDSLRLMREINKHAQRCQRRVKILLELHIADEETKFGFSLDECREMLAAGEWRQMENVQIAGLMMMASNVDDEAQIAAEFEQAAQFFDKIKARFFPEDEAFRERSWGMSDDFHIAVRHRSNIVRVGTRIFGTRTYGNASS